MWLRRVSYPCVAVLPVTIINSSRTGSSNLRVLGQKTNTTTEDVTAFRKDPYCPCHRNQSNATSIIPLCILFAFSFIALSMDFHPDHASILPADNSVYARNLSDDAETNRPTSSFDKTGLGHSNDPQTILNDLYPPSARRRGRSMGGSNGTDRESESVRRNLLHSFISHFMNM